MRNEIKHYIFGKTKQPNKTEQKFKNSKILPVVGGSVSDFNDAWLASCQRAIVGSIPLRVGVFGVFRVLRGVRNIRGIRVIRTNI